MSAAPVAITGMKELQEKLGGLKRSFQNRILRKGVRAGSREQSKVAKSTAPRRFGILRRSMSNKLAKMQRDGTILGVAGPRRKFTKTDKEGRKIDPSKYAHLVERGTRQRQNQPLDTPKSGKKRKSLSFTLNGQRRAFARIIQASKANPFMARAYEASKGSAMQQFTSKVTMELAKQAASSKPNEVDDGQ